MHLISIHVYILCEWDTLFSSVVTQSNTLLIYRAPLDRLQLLVQHREPSLLLSTQRRNLLLLIHHKLVELCQVGVVNHVH